MTIPAPHAELIAQASAVADDLNAMDYVIVDGRRVNMAGAIRGLISAVEQSQQERLNYATKLVDEERRRWYRALETAGLNPLEGLAPEVVGAQVEQLRELVEKMLWAVMDYDERGFVLLPIDSEGRFVPATYLRELAAFLHGGTPEP